MPALQSCAVRERALKRRISISRGIFVDFMRSATKVYGGNRESTAFRRVFVAKIQKGGRVGKIEEWVYVGTGMGFIRSDFWFCYINDECVLMSCFMRENFGCIRNVGIRGK